MPLRKLAGTQGPPPAGQQAGGGHGGWHAHPPPKYPATTHLHSPSVLHPSSDAHSPVLCTSQPHKLRIPGAAFAACVPTGTHAPSIHQSQPTHLCGRRLLLHIPGLALGLPLCRPATRVYIHGPCRFLLAAPPLRLLGIILALGGRGARWGGSPRTAAANRQRLWSLSWQGLQGLMQSTVGE